MRAHLVSVAAVVVALVIAACGSGGGSKPPADGGGAGSGGGAGASAQSDAGADKPIGPPITTAPPAWVRPADCLGVGETCQLGCSGTGAICQLDGNVCIPKPDPNGPAGRTADTPYCLAYSCMTFDQASCFCTGPAGAQFDSCGYGPAAVAGLCMIEGASCTDTACCDGLRCTAISTTSRICYKPCANNTDCTTGCCTDLKDTGDLECAPAAACQNPCVKRGGSCTTSTTCCNGTCVDSTAPDKAGCRPVCNTNADCDTGCCVLFANQPFGFCTSIGYCGCGAGCPAGSSCLTFDGSNLGCYKDCKEDTDCPGQCCTSDIAGEDHGSCITSNNCCPGGCPTGNSCLNFNNRLSCYKNCQQPSECSSSCCSQPPTGGTYGGCLPASECGF
jgi:hypothetical protein